jgi:hypothetical protein
MMLLLCSVPLSAISLMFGGISPSEIAVTYFVLASWVFFIISIGVFWSSMLKQTAGSVLLTYAVCVGYLIMVSALGAYMAITSSGIMPMSSGLTMIRGSAFSLANLCPTSIPSYALAYAKVCGHYISASMIAIVLQVGLGLILLLTASTHVMYCRANKSLSIRILVLAVSAAITWCVAGDQVMTSVARNLFVVTVPILLLLSMGAMLFATGPIRNQTGVCVMRYALSFRKAFTSDMGGGVPFMLLWTLVVYAAYGLAAAHNVSSASPAALSSHFLGSYCKIGLEVLSIVAGISAVGVLFSTFAKRPLAALCLFLFILVVFLGYIVILVNYVPGVSHASSFIWQSAAFYPFTAPMIETLGQGWGADRPMLWWPQQYTWLVTSVCYGAIALIALLLASAIASKQRCVQEE